jgi:hypothetical protein
MIAPANVMSRAPESRRESSDVTSFVSPCCLQGRRSRMHDPKAANPVDDGDDRHGQSQLPPATAWKSADDQNQSLMDVGW